MAQPELSYCASEVRTGDPERFFAAMFAPSDRREDLFALYAFNLELARIRDSVSEALLGEIRLQWWRDTVEAIAAGQGPVRPGHWVSETLAAAARNRDLPKDGLMRLIDARAFDLGEEAPPDLAAFEAYARDSAGGLNDLGLTVLDVRGGAARRAGECIGIAWALTGHLRVIPHNARARRSLLPADLVAEERLSLTDLYAGRRPPALAAIVARLAARARDLLAEARSLREEVPRAALPVLLTARLADRHLRRLARCGYDPFDPAMARPDGGRQFSLLAGWATGRY
jgi:NADH dehydrogenase [ubiquinone] 1 alpha subcomplex assembly factor 6